MTKKIEENPKIIFKFRVFPNKIRGPEIFLTKGPKDQRTKGPEDYRTRGSEDQRDYRSGELIREVSWRSVGEGGGLEEGRGEGEGERTIVCDVGNGLTAIRSTMLVARIAHVGIVAVFYTKQTRISFYLASEHVVGKFYNLPTVVNDIYLHDCHFVFIGRNGVNKFSVRA